MVPEHGAVADDRDHGVDLFVPEEVGALPQGRETAPNRRPAVDCQRIGEHDEKVTCSARDEKGVAVGGTMCRRSLVTVLTAALFAVVAGCGGASNGRAASPPASGTVTTSAPTTLAPTTTTTKKAKPSDPTKNIDLSGTPGVTAAEQKRAEALLKATLVDLPKYADPATAERDGFHSIGDALTGDEHLVKWSYVDDGHILDPNRPESLVYEMRNDKKTLVAAMFMMPFGSRFTDVPDVGGALDAVARARRPLPHRQPGAEGARRIHVRGPVLSGGNDEGGQHADVARVDRAESLRAVRGARRHRWRTDPARPDATLRHHPRDDLIARWVRPSGMTSTVMWRRSRTTGPTRSTPSTARCGVI